MYLWIGIWIQISNIYDNFPEHPIIELIQEWHFNKFYIGDGDGQNRIFQPSHFSLSLFISSAKSSQTKKVTEIDQIINVKSLTHKMHWCTQNVCFYFSLP